MKMSHAAKSLLFKQNVPGLSVNRLLRNDCYVKNITAEPQTGSFNVAYEKISQMCNPR